MKRFAFVGSVWLGLSGCATGQPAGSPFQDPAAFEGQEVRLCGQSRHGGLYPDRPGGTDFEVQGVPEEFFHVTNRGRKCLTGIVKRTGYDPSDPDMICLDYCRIWALDVAATSPQKVTP